jgi:hypothetical protein
MIVPGVVSGELVKVENSASRSRNGEAVLIPLKLHSISVLNIHFENTRAAL